MNVLITSLSRKVPLLKAFREASGAGGCVWGADSDPECVGRHFADRFWAMPPLTDPDTQEEVLEFCSHQRIGLVVPTRDGELTFFGELREALAAQGTHVTVGSPGAVEVCLDKQAFHDHCVRLGIPTAPTAATAGALDAQRLVVKDRRGAGGGGLAVGLDPRAARAHAERLEAPVFQPLIEGTEH
ncbi:MAG: carbamoyl-phosphate synthase, partial [Actinomycetota bacterium]|nr:carbamoyl-phosphate synthase [Actinomycetota bacterium]